MGLTCNELIWSLLSRSKWGPSRRKCDTHLPSIYSIWIWFSHVTERNRQRGSENVQTLQHFKARQCSPPPHPFMSYWWDLLLFLFKWCICEGLCSKPFCSYFRPEPRIKQDRTCWLKLALFSQLGSLPVSCTDLEMKSMEWGHGRDDRAVSPSSWQSWSLMPLCLSLAVNLLSLQPITGGSCLLLIVSLKLKFVITYWCMASWWLWAWTALTALTARCFPSLCLRCPVEKVKRFFFSWSLSGNIFCSAENRRPPPPSSCGVTAAQLRCNACTAWPPFSLVTGI